MFAGAYLLGSTGIRYHSPHTRELKWLPEILVRGKLQPTMLKERSEHVYQLVPGRMKNLVIINSNFGDFECLQVAADTGEKYADNVVVIPPLLARLTYAIEAVATFRNPPEKEVLLVITMTCMFADFVILRRNANFELRIAEHIKRKPDDCARIFPTIYQDFKPHATIFLVHDDYGTLVNDLKLEYQPENCFIRLFRRWDFSLLWGGLFYAMDEEDFDSRYRIPNFTSGIEASIGYRKRENEKCVILPEQSPVPCEIYGFDGVPQPIQLFYFHDYFQVYDRLVYQSRQASLNVIRATGSASQIIGYVDERGVPYANLKAVANVPAAAVETVKKEEEEIYANPKRTFETPAKEHQTIQEEDEDDGKDYEKDLENRALPVPIPELLFSPIKSESPNIKFIFRHNISGIEVCSNDLKERIVNSEGNEWTPLYLSMADGKPEIGEKAKTDYQRFPKRVIYDVLKIIGKPLKEIQIDSKWGFKLIEENRIVYFQVETPSGDRLIPQAIVISAFLKVMKLRVESALNNFVLKKIRLSTNFYLNDSQKAVFEEAALKNGLEIVSYTVTGNE